MSEAAEAYQTAIALDRNYARAYLYLGLTLAHMGRAEEAIVLVQRAMHLNPRDPNIADHFFIRGKVEALLGRPDEAIASLQRAAPPIPGSGTFTWTLPPIRHAAAYRRGET
jgi:tetratricopeptide (TPR) repeat protein